MRRLTAARVREIQQAAFADDVQMPDWRGWSESDLERHFSSAGAVRPQPHAVPVEDPALSELCEGHGLRTCARESLFGVQLAGAALLCHVDRRGCRDWLHGRGVSSDEIRTLLAAFDALNARADSLASRKPCIIRAHAGLCNKLRVVCAHSHIASEQGRPLVVLWRACTACPGRFAELFEPLADVTFLDDATCGPLTIDYEGCDCHPTVKHTPHEARSLGQLIPLPHLRAAIAANEDALGGPTAFVAVHIRRTDHMPKHQTTMEDFERFLNEHAPLPIFVATDNVGTQARLLARFGDRVRALKPIRKDDARGFRQTPLSDAVTEIFTCVAARAFKGSYCSSFSDTIHHLRLVHGTRSQRDEHAVSGAWSSNVGGLDIARLATAFGHASAAAQGVVLDEEGEV